MGPGTCRRSSSASSPGHFPTGRASLSASPRSVAGRGEPVVSRPRRVRGCGGRQFAACNQDCPPAIGGRRYGSGRGVDRLAGRQFRVPAVGRRQLRRGNRHRANLGEYLGGHLLHDRRDRPGAEARRLVFRQDVRPRNERRYNRRAARSSPARRKTRAKVPFPASALCTFSPELRSSNSRHPLRKCASIG